MPCNIRSFGRQHDVHESIHPHGVPIDSVSSIPPVGGFDGIACSAMMQVKIDALEILAKSFRDAQSYISLRGFRNSTSCPQKAEHKDCTPFHNAPQ